MQFDPVTLKPMTAEDEAYRRRVQDMQQQTNALHAAINTGRPFSFYFAGFPNPRQNPYSSRGDSAIAAFR